MLEIVEKRDGREALFDKQYIIKAINSAAKHTELGMDNELAIKIAESISKTDKKKISVEDIQNKVEEKLMASKRKDIAKEYISYRQERTRVREKDKLLTKKIKDILDCRNITNDNANVNQYSFSGKKQRVGDESHKQYASDNLLRDSVNEAFKNHYIYLHDFSEYSIGDHNCLFIDFKEVFDKGFVARNGDVRSPNSISSAFQQMAVIMQCQSQTQFGGCGSSHIDFDLAPYVKKSFIKHFLNSMIKEYMIENKIQRNNFKNEQEYKKWRKEVQKKLWAKIKTVTNDILIDNKEILEKHFYTHYNNAIFDLYEEGSQGAQAFYHNLNTLESRAGSQVPFTSINTGRDTSTEGRLVTEWLFNASLDGVGKHHKTSIFPISIFQYKKGVNDKEGTPNYNLKQLAIQSMCKRIYPNWVNCDFSESHEDVNDINTYDATMGCRTMLGYDRFTDSYTRTGRGNVVPTTIILPKLGIEYGICTRQRNTPDLDGFWEAFKNILDITKQSLVDRFAYIASQSPKSAPFMYDNNTMLDADKCKDNVYEAMKHNTLAIGYIGIAEMCKALFGKTQDEDEKVYNFAYSVVEYINKYAKKVSDEENLNFSCYATPAENLCNVAMKNLQNEFGIIKDVTDREYLTNSHHIPVWHEVSIFKKLQLEAPFSKLATGGCITYVETDCGLMKNPKAVEKIIDYAMDLDIHYLAFNFPINSCLKCGLQDGEVEDTCPSCGSKDIEHLARVTGYLSTDVSKFNAGKKAEVKDRVKHSKFTNINDLKTL